MLFVIVVVDGVSVLILALSLSSAYRVDVGRFLVLRPLSLDDWRSDSVSVAILEEIIRSCMKLIVVSSLTDVTSAVETIEDIALPTVVADESSIEVDGPFIVEMY